jgi:hypothetical protein
MDNVQSIGYGIEHHSRPAEDAGALAHRPGDTLLFAVELEGLCAFTVDLPFAFS